MATFLQLVNKVLVALREDQVAGFSSEPYTSMIQQFVNQAKEEIEDVGPWQSLRTEIAFSSAASTTTATVTGTTDRSYVLLDSEGRGMVFKTATGEECQIPVIPIEQLRRLRLGSDATTTQEPSFVAFVSDGTNLIAHFYPTPDAVYAYKGVFVVPQADLSDETDTLTIPQHPVVRKAIFYAMDERGSEFAGRLEVEAARADAALSAAILRDFGTEELTVTA